jgi:hypothetical protein
MIMEKPSLIRIMIKAILKELFFLFKYLTTGHPFELFWTDYIECLQMNTKIFRLLLLGTLGERSTLGVVWLMIVIELKPFGT